MTFLAAVIAVVLLVRRRFRVLGRATTFATALEDLIPSCLSNLEVRDASEVLVEVRGVNVMALGSRKPLCAVDEVRGVGMPFCALCRSRNI